MMYVHCVASWPWPCHRSHCALLEFNIIEFPVSVVAATCIIVVLPSIALPTVHCACALCVCSMSENTAVNANTHVCDSNCIDAQYCNIGAAVLVYVDQPYNIQHTTPAPAVSVPRCVVCGVWCVGVRCVGVCSVCRCVVCWCMCYRVLAAVRIKLVGRTV